LQELMASGWAFKAKYPRESHYINYKDLIDDHSFQFNGGFVVVKGCIPEETILNIRNQYFSSFSGGEYTFDGRQWNHICTTSSEHGIGTHPAISFVKQQSFLDLISQKQIYKSAGKILNCKKPILCKRAIVRSFSHLSSRCTHAHRDCDYYKIPDNSKAITAWIPLGPAGLEHGQLVYLEKSEQFHETINLLIKSDRTISSNLSELSSSLNLKWISPKVQAGDVIFHCLQNVHASFTTNNIEPRLSCDLRFAADQSALDPNWNSYWRGDDGL